ncbi:Hypothetical predicted protein [Mytilus galloprovincialis]|uniref:Uncharacterized protein n=1 Tax=Mytilus galloprovincialis TaxID=29158 RepID=A0A8B6E8U4_MYTGA|nr:Hypothetical predicted protein [Mytilus galloprovincialis]
MKDMSYILLCINAILVALMAMYVYENERRMRELSTGTVNFRKRTQCVKIRKEEIEIRKAIQEEKDYISKLQVSKQAADKTPVEGYGMSYRYFDEMAQTYCSSQLQASAFVFAIRRDCGGIAPTCNDICKDAKDDMLNAIGQQRKDVACFNAINIRKDHAKLQLNPNHSQPDAGKISMITYGYGVGGCTWQPNHCGPNYCCCKAFNN